MVKCFQFKVPKNSSVKRKTNKCTDEETVPRYLLQVFERVRQNADFMPSRQVFAQMRQELGANWRDRFSDFDEKPFAAASIGQV